MRCARRRMHLYLGLVAAVVLAIAPAAAGAIEDGHRRARFIVTLEPRADARAVAGEYRHRGSEIAHVYTAAINGFAATMSDAAVAGLLRDSRVVRIERDGVATVAGTQSNATWGLDRTDQRALPLDKTYTYGTTGAQVHAYVFDTGIHRTHSEFSGRIGTAYDAVTSGGDASDCHGHGTHVSGTIGGAVYGIAKQTVLHPIRVLGCTGSGSWSGVIAGIDWVIRNHVKPAVANFSLAGGAYGTVDDAVKRLIAAGVPTAIAAGNGGADACNYSPARVGDAVTVAATDSKDVRASWSNYGTCVDLFAPGVSIASASMSSNTASTLMSGSSMASPHVAGAMARYLEANPKSSPGQVTATLTDTSTIGAVSQDGGSPNRLLYLAAATPVEEPVNVAPSAGFDASCSDLRCAFADTSSDTDGKVTSWSWSFGDKSASTVQNPAHEYAADGTYTVTLTVTDDDGATSTTSKNVTVAAPPEDLVRDPVDDPLNSPQFTLDALAYKVKGLHHADLSWSGTSATSVDVYRSGTKVATVRNTGTYTDSLGTRGSLSVTYTVCEAATATCSNVVVAAL